MANEVKSRRSYNGEIFLYSSHLNEEKTILKKVMLGNVRFYCPFASMVSSTELYLSAVIDLLEPQRLTEFMQ